MSLHDAMREACFAVGIKPPRQTHPGKWSKTPVEGKAATNGSGRVLVFDDGRGGIAWNWVTGQEQRFTERGVAGANEIRAPRRDPEAERQAMAERAAVERVCSHIIRTARQDQHPYLVAKGFPDEAGLVVDEPRDQIPTHGHGQAMRYALGDAEGPFLIVPGRIGQRVTTVQFIAPDGTKLNIKGGQMRGASHRIATGRETWVCEGIATALSVRAALRLLGRSATVLSAFAANNVAAVAAGLTGSIIAADHDKPLEQLHGLGTGEFYACKAERVWTMPPQIGDFNDMHMQDGLRSVALHLREVS